MIRHTCCQRCGEELDATNTDKLGNKHPDEDSCFFWERLVVQPRRDQPKAKSKSIRHIELGESGA